MTKPRELLLAVAETIAREQFDGHFALMQFTTNWKAVFGTPPSGEEGRLDVDDTPGYRTAEEALYTLIREELDSCAKTAGVHPVGVRVG